MTKIAEMVCGVKDNVLGLGRAMWLEKHTRMTEDVEAAVLEEAVGSSYQKGGEHASLGLEGVSKETMMNKIHSLEFLEAEPAAEKKAVPYLYIDVDEWAARRGGEVWKAARHPRWADRDATYTD